MAIIKEEWLPQNPDTPDVSVAKLYKVEYAIYSTGKCTNYRDSQSEALSLAISTQGWIDDARRKNEEK